MEFPSFMSQMLYSKALQFYQSKNLVAAKNSCWKIKSASDCFGKAAFLLGCIAKDEKRWDLAASQFKKSLSVNQSDFLSYVNLSEVHQNQSQFDLALEASETSLPLADAPDAHAHCLRQLAKIQLELARHEEALCTLKKAIALKPNSAASHYIFGYVLLQTHKASAAITSLRKAIELGLASGTVFRDLGRAYILENMQTEAIAALEKSIELDGPDDSAVHMINALRGQHTEVAPDIYIERLFDDLAGNFEKQLITDLEYDIPTKIVTLLQEESYLQGSKSHILDLGCGTGLVGQAMAPYSASIVGVDLSQKMLNMARDKGTYSKLSKNNILDELCTIDMTAFDYIIAADVLIYMGALVSLFETLSQTNPIKKSSTFIFSVELSSAKECQLLASGRYAHSEQYIDKLCEKYGFSIEVQNHTTIRTERGKAIDGAIYFIQPKRPS
ncbi:MAG: hypothetical protein COB37_00410 [Kordiimonadales bacterium]|nr:MAG: hypothetical protein COB37_00410 [Kordiimonadales bacterium]